MIVLITGGSGLVGRELTKILLAEGHTVRWLSRSKRQVPQVEVFTWNVEEEMVEAAALKGVDVVVHLAGEGIADKRWTTARKDALIASRVKPLQLLQQHFNKIQHHPRSLVSASAIGFYGGDTGEILQTEQSGRGHDFLAECTVQWEAAGKQFADALNCRAVWLRLGVVFSHEGGALAKLVQPIQLGAGAALGSGQQWLSWVHIADAARLFAVACSDTSMAGVYNVVAPQAARHHEVIKQAAEVLQKPLWLPNVPAFALRLALGEMAVVVLGSSKVASNRLADTPFAYQFPQLTPALEDLLAEKTVASA